MVEGLHCAALAGVQSSPRLSASDRLRSFRAGRGGRVNVVVFQVVGRRRLPSLHSLPLHPPVLEPHFHLLWRHKGIDTLEYMSMLREQLIDSDNRSKQILCFQLLGREYFLISFLLCDAKLNIFWLWTKQDI